MWSSLLSVAFLAMKARAVSRISGRAFGSGVAEVKVRSSRTTAPPRSPVMITLVKPSGFVRFDEFVGEAAGATEEGVVVMAYLPSVATETEALENVVNAATLKPALLYPFVVGLRFVPMFVPLLAFWVVLRSGGDVGFSKKPRLKRIYLGLCGFVLAATSLLSIQAFNDDVVWQAGLPGRERLWGSYFVLWLANAAAGWLGYRVFRGERIVTYRPLFGYCAVVYLVIGITATVIDHQYNLLNRHYLDKRRPTAYVARDPEGMARWASSHGSELGGVGPDLEGLMRSADFQAALRSGRFYKQNYDEPFQVMRHVVMYGYRLNPNEERGRPIFRTIRFPLEAALALRFEPCGN